jgi:hypothetical protein
VAGAERRSSYEDRFRSESGAQQPACGSVQEPGHFPSEALADVMVFAATIRTAAGLPEMAPTAMQRPYPKVVLTTLGRQASGRSAASLQVADLLRLRRATSRHFGAT